MAEKLLISSLKRFLPGLPSLPLITAWEQRGSQWQFRLLGFGEVVHSLRVRDEAIEIFDDGKDKWVPIGFLGTAVIECRPIDDFGKVVRWDAVYRLANLPCPLIGE